MSRVVRFGILVPFLLCACSSPEVLMPITGGLPAGIDLSGQWQLRPESLRGQPRIREAIDRTDGVDSKKILQDLRMRGSRDGETKGGLVGVFLQTGESLKITQTSHALFISFDRSVVEEYRFGEDRPVNVGAADAHRVSGWEGNAYVIETLGEKGQKLTDRYRLADGGTRLVRTIALRSKEMETVTIVHEFDRREP